MIFSLLAFPLFTIVYLFMSTFPTVITKKAFGHPNKLNNC